VPDALEPTQATLDCAARYGKLIADEWPMFHDYHSAKGTLSADWNASLRTWLSRAPLAWQTQGRPLSVPANGIPEATHRVYPESWGPTEANADHGRSLGLTEKDIWDRWDLVRHKEYQQPFSDPERQFNRELAYEVADRRKRATQPSAKERLAFELPGMGRGR
jgi:hypothetical protein